MKCCGSPTTSIAADAPRERCAVEATMQALVFGEILKPMTAALGPVGEQAVGAIAQSLFVRATT